MDAKERTYSVLLVSASTNFNNKLLDFFPAPKYDPVIVTGSIRAAKCAVDEQPFDFIIVNSPLPDNDGLRFSIDAAKKGTTIVLLMLPSDQYATQFERFTSSGVFLVEKPLTRSTITMALNWLAGAREQLRINEEKVLSAERKISEIRVINRAKWLLISEMNMSEADAHRYIEKQAMDRCVSKREIAEEIIDLYG
ncbi:MAG: ANTAR domain-containing protein [Clostridia bacterium]|nr:ANTAR domain-containing protein [Clostridia bacterium]